MSKTPNWPAELRKPITLDALDQSLGFYDLNEDEQARQDRLFENYVAECARRIQLIAQFFQIGELAHDPNWEFFLIRLCRHWNVPGFHVAATTPRGPGAPKQWTDRRICELFADVMALASDRG